MSRRPVGRSRRTSPGSPRARSRPSRANPGNPSRAPRELTVPFLQGQTEPQACLAYAVPEPGSDPYAPFLLLVARLWTAMAQAGGDGGPGRASVYFPLLEDPAVLGVSTAAQSRETAAAAFARLEAFVAETTAPRLRDEERATAHQMFGFFLGTAELPDFVLARNPYGLALSLARREQLALDPARLNRALETLTDQDLHRAASEIFAPGRHAGAFLRPGR